MGLRVSRRPFLYSSHLIIEVLDKRKCTGLPIPIFHKAEAAFICANNTFLIVSSFSCCYCRRFSISNVILASQLFGNSPDVAIKHYYTKVDEEQARKALEA